MPIWLSRTIPMSKYFYGSRPLRHNEVQLYLKNKRFLKPLLGFKYVNPLHSNNLNTHYFKSFFFCTYNYVLRRSLRQRFTLPFLLFVFLWKTFGKLTNVKNVTTPTWIWFEMFMVFMGECSYTICIKVGFNCVCFVCEKACTRDCAMIVDGVICANWL